MARSMSRSFQKTKIFPIAKPGSGTVKQWKKECNRSMRRVPIDEIPQKKEHGDPWTGPTDVKTYVYNADKKRMRK